MSSIFTKIINGEIPSYKIYEDNLCFAFLDINPMKLGHTLIVPKQEVGYVLDLDDEVYEHIMRIAKKRIGPAVQSATGCDRIGLLVEGYGIQDHFHLHVVPIDKAGELDFDKAHKESEEDMKEVHLKILNQM